MADVGEALQAFYVEWGRKIEVLVDRSRPFQERLAALWWIDDNTGEARSPGDDLETIADQLRGEGVGW